MLDPNNNNNNTNRKSGGNAKEITFVVRGENIKVVIIASCFTIAFLYLRTDCFFNAGPKLCVGEVH